MKNIKLHIVFALVILTGIAFPVWRNVLDNQFLYDDDTFVVLNESIRTLTPATKFFSPDASSNNPQMNRDVWRPLTTFSYAVNYALSGLSPRAFHLFNLLGHILNGLLVFLMAQNMMLALSVKSKASPLPPRLCHNYRGEGNTFFESLLEKYRYCIIKQKRGASTWHIDTVTDRR